MVMSSRSVVPRTRNRGWGAVVTRVTSTPGGSASIRAYTALRRLTKLVDPIPMPLSTRIWSLVGQSWGWTIHNGFSIFIVGGIMKALIGAAVLPSAWGLVARLDGRGGPRV